MSISAQVSFVLVAYNEPWRADQLCQLVRELRPGMRVQPAVDGHAALELCKRQVPSLLIVDGELDGLDGRQLLRELRRHGPTQRLPCHWFRWAATSACS
ncbi:MAG: response regulator, partial [Gammaproteobacteria bacterium]|nr:response regulator [Gammaproteobacteria bacterium]